MIDTHCHLYDEAFNEDRPEALQRALDAGVAAMLMPAIDKASAPAQEALTQPCLYHMAGLHPTSVGADYREELDFVAERLRNPVHDYVAIGEIGLDLYWDRTYAAEQLSVLRQQLLWAREYDMPVSLHVRNAYDELFQLLADIGHTSWRGVLHCFSGNESHAAQALRLGFHLGIGGVVTFKKSALPAIVEQTPLERILLETDAPYLAPVPHRGQRNESSYLPLVAQKIADIKQMPLADVDAVTTANAAALFGLGL